MAQPPAFQFYAADFLCGTARMSAEDVGHYIRLLAHQWVGGPLTEQEGTLFVGGTIPAAVLSKFAVVNGKLTNLRLEQERTKQNSFRQSKVNAGKA